MNSPTATGIVKCPKCGGTETFREEVDIGVGIQFGPIHCNTCGFDEAREVQELIIADDDGDEL